MTREIPLSGGGVAIVDDDMFEELSQYRWHLVSRGRYALRFAWDATKKRQIGILMHRQIMNAPPHMSVDHIDSCGLHNTRANMRLATHQDNMRYQRKRNNSRSAYKGVWRKSPTSRWQASICVSGKQIRLGLFDSEIDAALAYNTAAIKHFGEFARLNEVPA